MHLSIYPCTRTKQRRDVPKRKKNDLVKFPLLNILAKTIGEAFCASGSDIDGRRAAK